MYLQNKINKRNIVCRKCYPQNKINKRNIVCRKCYPQNKINNSNMCLENVTLKIKSTTGKCV